MPPPRPLSLSLIHILIEKSDRLAHVHSDIRGPLYVEALRMQAQGIPVLKLNTGNPGNFGFALPESVRQSLVSQVDKACLLYTSRCV